MFKENINTWSYRK